MCRLGKSFKKKKTEKDIDLPANSQEPLKQTFFTFLTNHIFPFIDLLLVPKKGDQKPGHQVSSKKKKDYQTRIKGGRINKTFHPL